MDRRTFVKISAVAAAVPALAGASAGSTTVHASGPTAPVAAPIPERATYVVAGTVRLHAPVVEIGGITNSQSVSWLGPVGSGPETTTFLSFEQLDSPHARPSITVRGGRLESLTVLPLEA